MAALTGWSTLALALLTGLLAVATFRMASEMKRQFDLLHRAALQVSLYNLTPQCSTGTQPSMLFRLTNVCQSAALRLHARGKWADGTRASVGEIGDGCTSVAYTEVFGGVLLPHEEKRFSLLVQGQRQEFAIEWSEPSGSVKRRSWRLERESDDSWRVVPL